MHNEAEWQKAHQIVARAAKRISTELDRMLYNVPNVVAYDTLAMMLIRELSERQPWATKTLGDMLVNNPALMGDAVRNYAAKAYANACATEATRRSKWLTKVDSITNLVPFPRRHDS